MTTKSAVIVFLALAISVASVANRKAHAQTDAEVQSVKQVINGQKIFVSYRDGGPVYGTYIFREIHFCRSGRFIVFGQSRKQTVLGNEQVNNWKDSGSWEVIRYQNQIAVHYVSASGTRDVVPIYLLPDGRIWIGDGVSIEWQGSAKCG